MKNNYEYIKNIVDKFQDISYEEKKEIKKKIDELIFFNFIKNITILGVSMLIGLILLLFAFGFLNRHYSVWAMEMGGKAKLAEATQSRQIQIEQAKAEKEAAKFTAEAIKIVGKATKNYPEYRQQIYIQAFAEALTGGKIEQIMYIPTEAGIPILEAGKNVIK